MKRWGRGLLLGLAGLLVSVTVAVAQTDISAQLTFTTIDVPGAGITVVEGINDAGDMVGYYSQNSAQPAHAFLLRNGVFTFFDYPGADQTRAVSINNIGVIVGFAIKGNEEIGFAYDGNVFGRIGIPGKAATATLGINDVQDIVGGDGTLDSTVGFLLRDHRIKTLSPPGNYGYVYATGINNSGKVVGWTTLGLDTYSFVYFRGRYKLIAFPGASGTEAWKINDDDVVVGWYSAPPAFLGFAMSHGKYFSIARPGSTYTLVVGINNLGQTVGSYSDDKITYHGFRTNAIGGYTQP
jgi:uncharacterized membrane protein